jgi:hypothetical protein
MEWLRRQGDPRERARSRARRVVQRQLEEAARASKESATRLDRAVAGYRLLTELEAAERTMRQT